MHCFQLVINGFKAEQTIILLFNSKSGMVFYPFFELPEELP